MPGRLSVSAHLDFEVEVAGQGVVRGTVRGHGTDLTLDVDRPEVFAGRADAGAVEVIAEGLARRGLTVRVVQGSTPLITLGASRAPWWHRRATGSRHIRLGSVRGAWTSGRTEESAAIVREADAAAKASRDAGEEPTRRAVGS